MTLRLIVCVYPVFEKSLSRQRVVSSMWNCRRVPRFYSARNRGRISSVERALVSQFLQSEKWWSGTNYQELRKTKKQGTTCTAQTPG